MTTVPLVKDLSLIAQRFVARRLQIAREYRELTRADLAAMIDKSSSAISQYESGLIKPDARTIAAIALALNIPAPFFARPTEELYPDLDSCNFRSLRSTTTRRRRHVLSFGAFVVDIYRALDRFVDFPIEQISAARETLGQSLSPESAATLLRSMWHLGDGPISHTLDLLESHGTIVVRVPIVFEQIDAFSWWGRDRPFVFLVRGFSTPTRTRFDAIHELAHLLLHSDTAPGNPQHEEVANRFASNFLLPEEPFEAEFPRRMNWDRIVEMKRRWKVSLAAIIWRAHNLRLLSYASYRRAFVHLNATGWRYNEPAEPDLESPSLLTQAIELLADLPHVNLADSLALPRAEIDQIFAN